MLRAPSGPLTQVRARARFLPHFFKSVRSCLFCGTFLKVPTKKRKQVFFCYFSFEKRKVELFAELFSKKLEFSKKMMNNERSEASPRVRSTRNDGAKLE